MKKIAVIGATGNLAPIVVKELLQNEFHVRALVRNPTKAAKLLPNEVEIIQADLEKVESLVQGLQGIDVVYLNLSTEHPNAAFQPEREGICNLLEAIRHTKVNKIFKISGLGAYRKDFAQGKTIFVNEIRSQGHQLIRDSGLPFAFFHPSWFMESLQFMFRQGNKLNGFKPIHHPIHWIAGKDYARMVVTAILKDEPANKDYVMMGPEAITMHDALIRYSKTIQPNLKVSETSIGLIKILGLFVEKFRLLAMYGEYFKDFKEEFIAADTWAELGEPTLTIETFEVKK